MTKIAKLGSWGHCFQAFVYLEQELGSVRLLAVEWVDQGLALSRMILISCMRLAVGNQLILKMLEVDIELSPQGSNITFNEGMEILECNRQVTTSAFRQWHCGSRCCGDLPKPLNNLKCLPISIDLTKPANNLNKVM